MNFPNRWQEEDIPIYEGPRPEQFDGPPRLGFGQIGGRYARVIECHLCREEFGEGEWEEHRQMHHDEGVEQRERRRMLWRRALEEEDEEDEGMDLGDVPDENGNVTSEMNRNEDRYFRLSFERELGQKAKETRESVRFWLDDGDDGTLTNWIGEITGPHGTPFAGRTYNLRIYCGAGFPNEAPEVQFVNMIVLPGVDVLGNVCATAIGNWENNFSIKHLLVGIRRLMENEQIGGLYEPPPGSNY